MAKTPLKKFYKMRASDIGAEVKLAGFVRFGLGEGIDKGPEEDFASEVAAAVGSS